MLKFNYNSMDMVEIDLTGTCNLSCPLCARNYKAFQSQVFYQERSTSEIIQQIKQFKNLKKINLVGATSEPTLFKDIFKLIDEINALDIEIEICTNGSTHDEKFWYKLGQVLKEKDAVYFSVCGSTQELHEVYRVGSNLNYLLSNAKAFREGASNKKIDWIQHILFKYNYEDLQSIEMKNIIEQFNNVNYTKTYFTREVETYKDKTNINRLQIYNEDLSFYDRAQKYAAKMIRDKDNKKYNITCESIENNNCHINQAGNIYPCYIWLEESGHKTWDMDYQKILDFKYNCCVFCEKNLKNMLSLKGCELL